MYLKILAIFENPSHSLKKASISLKISSNRIGIFEKPSNHFNSLKFSENIFMDVFQQKDCQSIETNS
jgi:hypothetical protein